MTVETGSSARVRTAVRSLDDGSARAGTVGQLTRADPLTRQRVVYGIAAYAVARLASDRRFQTSVIMLAIGLAVAKSALEAGAKDLIVGIERFYLHVEPGNLHLLGGGGSDARHK